VVHGVASRRTTSLGGLTDQRCRITSAAIRGPITSVAMPNRDRTSLDIHVRITSAKMRMDIHLGYGTVETSHRTMRGEGAGLRRWPVCFRLKAQLFALVGDVVDPIGTAEEPCGFLDRAAVFNGGLEVIDIQKWKSFAQMRRIAISSPGWLPTRPSGQSSRNWQSTFEVQPPILKRSLLRRSDVAVKAKFCAREGGTQLRNQLLGWQDSTSNCPYCLSTKVFPMARRALATARSLAVASS
jgi:hypothetical protein